MWHEIRREDHFEREGTSKRRAQDRGMHCKEGHGIC